MTTCFLIRVNSRNSRIDPGTPYSNLPILLLRRIPQRQRPLQFASQRGAPIETSALMSSTGFKARSRRREEAVDRKFTDINKTHLCEGRW